jgi:hypothetical protein
LYTNHKALILTLKPNFLIINNRMDLYVGVGYLLLETRF